MRKIAFVMLTIAAVLGTLNAAQYAQAGCGALDITCKDSKIRETGRQLDPTGPDVAAKLWGTAGRAAYPAAAKIMRERNPGTAKPLSSAHKRLLARRYGNIVDSVRVVYGAKMMEKWCAVGECVKIGGTESAAQTYGNMVYIRDQERPVDLNQFLLLAHELKHVQQQKGRLDTFGYDYFKAYKEAGQNYANNRMEQEAEAEVAWFAQRVICPSTGCQWR